MNSVMWSHRVTASAMDTLVGWGCQFVLPIVKELACKDVGNGALAPVSQIVDAVVGNLGNIDLAEDSIDDVQRMELFDQILTNNNSQQSAVNYTSKSSTIHSTRQHHDTYLTRDFFIAISSIVSFLFGFALCAWFADIKKEKV